MLSKSVFRVKPSPAISEVSVSPQTEEHLHQTNSPKGKRSAYEERFRQVSFYLMHGKFRAVARSTKSAIPKLRGRMPVRRLWVCTSFSSAVFAPVPAVRCMFSNDGTTLASAGR